MLDQVAPSSPIDVSRHSEVERRVRVRYPTSFVTLCQNEEATVDDFWWLARVQDISSKGIGFLVSHPFESDAILLIEPTETAGKIVESLQARVVHKEARPGEGWCIGCEFCTPLTEDQLRALVA